MLKDGGLEARSGSRQGRDLGLALDKQVWDSHCARYVVKRLRLVCLHRHVVPFSTGLLFPHPLVMHLPADGAKATVFAIPRDSYVDIPGYGMNKINAAYAFGVSEGHGDKAGGARLAVQAGRRLGSSSASWMPHQSIAGLARLSNRPPVEALLAVPRTRRPR